MEVSPREIFQIWTFLDGAIMTVDVRHHLWRSWGFCERHTWAHAAAEIELRGGRPFGTSILYADLVGRAAHAVANAAVPWSFALRRLREHDTCYTCDYMAGTVTATPFASSCRQAEVVNRLARTVPLLVASLSEWQSRVCPDCSPGGRGLACRRHLLGGAPTDRGALTAHLQDLHERLELFVRSMTHRGPVATAPARASWVEALGWFAGWTWPLEVVR